MCGLELAWRIGGLTSPTGVGFVKGQERRREGARWAFFASSSIGLQEIDHDAEGPSTPDDEPAHIWDRVGRAEMQPFHEKSKDASESRSDMEHLFCQYRSDAGSSSESS